MADSWQSLRNSKERNLQSIGSQAQEWIRKGFNFFRQNGCTAEASAGICGNIFCESGWDKKTAIKDGVADTGNTKSGGLCMWNASNFTTMKEAGNSSSYGTWQNLDFQLSYVLTWGKQQSKGKAPLPTTNDAGKNNGNWSAFKACTTVKESAFWWMHCWERCQTYRYRDGLEAKSRTLAALYIYNVCAKGMPFGKSTLETTSKEFDRIMNGGAEDNTGVQDVAETDNTESADTNTQETATLDTTTFKDEGVADVFDPFSTELVNPNEVFDEQSGKFSADTFPINNAESALDKSIQAYFINPKAKTDNANATLPPVLKQILKPTILVSEHSINTNNNPTAESTQSQA